MRPPETEKLLQSKDMVNKTKRQPTEWEKIFTNPMSDRGLISKIHEELKKFDTKRSHNSIKKKWSTDLNRELSTDESQTAERHLRKCSTSLDNREMQIKTTLRFHLIPVRMAKIKNTDDNLCCKSCGVKEMLLHCW